MCIGHHCSSKDETFKKIYWCWLTKVIGGSLINVWRYCTLWSYKMQLSSDYLVTKSLFWEFAQLIMLSDCRPALLLVIVLLVDLFTLLFLEPKVSFKWFRFVEAMFILAKGCICIVCCVCIQTPCIISCNFGGFILLVPYKNPQVHVIAFDKNNQSISQSVSWTFII